MQYMIVTSDNTIGLAIEVQKYIDQGWTPQGGVSMEVWQSQAGKEIVNHPEYAQALVSPVAEPLQTTIYVHNDAIANNTLVDGNRLLRDMERFMVGGT